MSQDPVTRDAVVPDALRRAVEAWSAQDPDPQTRAETVRLLQAADGGDPDHAAARSPS